VPKKPETSHLNPTEYAELVDELMKDQPDQKLVRKLMVKCGIPYSPDLITQMGSVLQTLSKSERSQIQGA
jgi:hypothetical protein